MTAGLLNELCAPDPPPFALLYRPEDGDPDVVDVLVGDVDTLTELADLDMPPAGAAAGSSVLVMIPYQQVGDRGFVTNDDHSPPIAMTVTRRAVVPSCRRAVVPVREVLARLPDVPIRLAGDRFDVEDDESVRAIVADEIGAGEGANFVIKRSFVDQIVGYGVRYAVTFFRRLLERKFGSYWTFAVHVGDRAFVGASPNGMSACATASRS